MIRFDVEVRRLDEVKAEVRAISEKLLPKALKAVSYALAHQVKNEAVEGTLKGDVLRPRGTHNDLRIYASGQAVETTAQGSTWGLPSDGEMRSRGPAGALKPLAEIGRFMETGGLITPVRAKMLRIPIPNGPALTPAGYDRFDGIPLRDTDQGWHIMKKRDGRLFLGKPDGDGPSRAWYRLVGSARINPHPWMAKAVDRMTQKADDIIDAVMAQQMGG